MLYQHRAELLVHDFPAEAARMLAGATRVVSLWQARGQQRRKLKDMTDEQLRDIGVSRIEALREGSKPFWRAYPFGFRTVKRRDCETSATHNKDSEAFLLLGEAGRVRSGASEVGPEPRPLPPEPLA